ncbi:MAG: hypothetical protein ACM3L9_08835 [Deltaproteobacteria bacterium]
MRFRRQTVADGAVPAARLHVGPGFAAAEVSTGLLRPLEAFGALAVQPLFGTLGTVTAVLAIATIHSFAAVGTVATVEAVLSILTVPPVIAPAVVLERTVTIPVARTLRLMAVFAMWTVGAVVIAALAAYFRHSGLIAPLTGHHRLFAGRFEDVFTFRLAAEAGL